MIDTFSMYRLVKTDVRVDANTIMTACVWKCPLCHGTISGMGGPGSFDVICQSCGDKIISGNVKMTQEENED